MANAKIIGGIVGLSLIGASFYVGFQSKDKIDYEIDNAKKGVAVGVWEMLPESEKQRHIDHYKETLQKNPDKYKKDILDITQTGIKKYHTDVFVRSVREGIDYAKQKYHKKDIAEK